MDREPVTVKSRFVYDRGEVIYAEEGGVITVNKMEKTEDAGFYVIPDCQPFKSMINGQIINSKSTYRHHLKEHGCVEVGNDSTVLNPVRKPMKSPPGLRQELIRTAKQKFGW